MMGLDVEASKAFDLSALPRVSGLSQGDPLAVIGKPGHFSTSFGGDQRAAGDAAEDARSTRQESWESAAF